MKSNDQKKLEAIYESSVLEEGVWDQITHKLGTMGKQFGGIAANVGNKAANPFRSAENNVDPVEAQVNHLWNSFRINTIKLIDTHLKKQAALLDFEQRGDTIVLRQIAAIKEAHKFLQDPPSYLRDAKNNNPTQPSASSGGDGGGNGGDGGGNGGDGGGSKAERPESDNSKTSSNRGGPPSNPATPTLDQSRLGVTTDPSPTQIEAENKDIADYIKSNPKVFEDTLAAYRKSSKNNDKFIANFVKTASPGLRNFLLNKISSNKEVVKARETSEKKPLGTETPARFESFNDFFAPFREKKNVLVEADAKPPSNNTSENNSSAEKIQHRGTRDLEVQIRKFFEQFIRECEQFIASYDKVRPLGKYEKGRADRNVFNATDIFLKRLLKILYIPNAGKLQVANPFKEKMK